MATKAKHVSGIKLVVFLIITAFFVAGGLFGDRFGSKTAHAQSGFVAAIYRDGDFGGQRQLLQAGRYNLSDLAIGNDQLSSLVVADGYQVTLFEDGNFSGRRKVFTGQVRWVGNDFNDRTSSIIVERIPRKRDNRTVAVIYSNRDFGGRQQILSVGQYNLSDLTIGNDQLSSLVVAKGYRVILFEHGDFGGRYQVFTGEVRWVGNDFNDLTSSIIVERDR